MKKNTAKTQKPLIPTLLAGLLNGLLGTGGGIPLFFYLSKQKNGREAYATASVGILLLSLQTVFLYRDHGVSIHRVSPLLPVLAIFGGALGAWLCGKMDRRFLTLLFGVLLLLSGVYLLGKEIFVALS